MLELVGQLIVVLFPQELANLFGRDSAETGEYALDLEGREGIEHGRRHVSIDIDVHGDVGLVHGPILPRMGGI